MQSRNDYPGGLFFNFGTDSVFNVLEPNSGGFAPITNAFMLLDGTRMRLLDGSTFLLLEP